jgi:uncharacterized RDD family membrane protein YckC
MAALPPPPPPPPPPAAPYGYATPQYLPAAPTGPAPGVTYAGFWIRFVAYLIDSIIIFVPVTAVLVAIAIPSFASVSCTTIPNATPFGSTTTCTGLDAVGWFFPLAFLISVVVPGVYFVLFWAHGGQSLGQKLLRLHVVDANTGGPISTGRALGRYVGFLVSAYVLYIGLIWAAFDARKQGWHDKMANTFVVQRS